jgi:hypothetical protein
MKKHCEACKFVAVVILGVFLWLPLLAQQVLVGWHDHMYLQPGDGVQLNRQQEPAFPGLLIMSPSAPRKISGGGESIAFAQHTYNLISKLNANSSVSLNGLAFNGDVSVSFFGRQTFNANDLVFIDTITENLYETDFTPLSFSSNFWAQVGGYQKYLQDALLYSAITSTFGTHYVAGYRSQAMVSVLYSFHYASSSVRQQTIVSGSASTDAGNFSAFVSSFFGSTNTTASMSYQFYSSDPSVAATNIGVALAGNVQNYQQFTNLETQISKYAATLNQTNAKITGYILAPLSAVPNFLTTLGISHPTTNNPANYDGFLEAYTALQAWIQSLDPWILNGDALSWLNGQGRQLVQGSWLEAEGYLTQMKSIAFSHFTTNATLYVPPEVTGFLADNLNTVALPKIYNLDNFENSNNRYFIGRVDCGCRNLTIPIPFSTISELQGGTNNGTLDTIYYDPVAFQKIELDAAPNNTVRGEFQTLFASPQWACLTNTTGNPNLNGYFVASEPENQKTNWSLVISGGTDVNGNAIIIDETALTDTTSGSCPGSCTVTFTNLISASTVISPLPDRETPGFTPSAKNQNSFLTYQGEKLEPNRWRRSSEDVATTPTKGRL